MKNFFLLYYQLKLNPLSPMPKFDMQGLNGFVGNMRRDIHHQSPFCVVTIAGELEECGTAQSFPTGAMPFQSRIVIRPKRGSPRVPPDHRHPAQGPRKWHASANLIAPAEALESAAGGLANSLDHLLGKPGHGSQPRCSPVSLGGP
jgi:hypothetical protein